MGNPISVDLGFRTEYVEITDASEGTFANWLFAEKVVARFWP